MVIFHSYVSLPEGIFSIFAAVGFKQLLTLATNFRQARQIDTLNPEGRNKFELRCLPIIGLSGALCLPEHVYRSDPCRETRPLMSGYCRVTVWTWSWRFPKGCSWHFICSRSQWFPAIQYSSLGRASSKMHNLCHAYATMIGSCGSKFDLLGVFNHFLVMDVA